MNKYCTEVLVVYKKELAFIKKNMIKLYPELKANPNALRREIKNFLPEYVETKYSETNDRGAAMTGYLIAMIDMEGKAMHHYIADDNLVNFLKDTEVRHPENACPKSESESDFFIVHTHNDCYIFANFYSMKTGETHIVAFNKKGCLVFSPNKEKFIQKIKKVDKEAARLARLSLNFRFYLQAFPEAEKSGLPADMCKSNRQFSDKNRAKVVGVTEKILDISSGSKTPHFRSGFFRTYYADRYVNMKGKTQFIEATIINKDKAKTVIGENV